MLKLKVTYFLTEEGLNYFPAWYDAVFKVTSKQDGFVSMCLEQENDHPIVYLHFEDQKKLDVWTETDAHDLLASKLENYFIKPQEVIVEEISTAPIIFNKNFSSPTTL